MAASQPSANRYRSLRFFALALAFFYLIFFGFAPHILAFHTRDAISAVAWGQAFFDGVINLLSAFFFFFAAVWSRRLMLLVMPPLLLLSAVANYAISKFGLPVNADMVGLALEANLEEARSVFSLPLLIYLLFSLAVLVPLAKWRNRFQPQKTEQPLLFLSVLFIGAAVFSGAFPQPRQFAPYHLLSAIHDYTARRMDKTPKIDVGALPASWHDKAPSELTVVLVVGESLRADHLGLNGYARNTTPLLGARDDMMFFPVRSCTALTRTAVPCLLTRKTVAEADLENSAVEITIPENSLISVFKRMGFATEWIGMQGSRAMTDTPFLDIMEEADGKILVNQYAVVPEQKDIEALPYLDRFLQEKNPFKLVVIHTMGSHWPYTERYGEKFRTFQPECPKTSFWSDMFSQDTAMQECDQVKDALINSYDNSVLYTDYVINAVMERLKGRPALLLFVSDHGESLGEKGAYLHGNRNIPEQRATAMFIGATEEFTKMHPDFLPALKRRTSIPISHDVVFHSIIDCAGIDSAAVDKAMSLCSPVFSSALPRLETREKPMNNDRSGSAHE